MKAGSSPKAAATAAVDSVGPLLGVPDIASQVREESVTTDYLGITHVKFEQVVGGYPVYGGAVAIHLARDGRTVQAITSSLVPDVSPTDSAPASTTSAEAVDRSMDALPGARLVGSPKLMIFPQAGAMNGGPAAVLAWFVDLADDAGGVYNTYVVDADSGHIASVIDREQTAKNRAIYTALGGTSGFYMPGFFVRGEGSAASGSPESDAAYFGTGATYDYYNANFHRDSYDNHGAQLISTVNFGQTSNPSGSNL